MPPSSTTAWLGFPAARRRARANLCVSRTLVRQALQKLAQDGVIVLRPNAAHRCPSPPAATASMCSTRGASSNARSPGGSPQVEYGATGRAAPDRRVRARATRSQNKQEAIRLSGEFHLKLARMSGNPIFVRLLEELLPTTSLLMALLTRHRVNRCVSRTATASCCRSSARASPVRVRPPRCGATSTRSSARCSQPVTKAVPALRDVFKNYR